MSTDAAAFLLACEMHDRDALRVVLDGGFAIHEAIDGKPPVDWLIEMYYRSDRFAECLRLLLDRGAMLGDPVLRPVLLDDVAELDAMLARQPGLIRHRGTMVCAFTPLVGASLLHVAAEYGHAAVARRLIALGADIDACAATDEFGFNGHTPLFHTVNSNDNRSANVMSLLLDAGARVDVRLRGLTWGSGFPWETICYDVTPISYAQLGLLPQVHRREHDIYANIEAMLVAAGRKGPPLANVPNRYLAG